MKDYRRAAVFMIAVMFCFGSSAGADYRFDDLGGPSGISFQWMILNDAGQTFGAGHSVAMDVSGDVITGDDAALNVLTGTSETPLTNRTLNTMFWVVALETGPASFTMNFGSPALAYDAATTDMGLGSTVYEYSSGQPYTSQYSSVQEAVGQSTGQTYYNALWHQYNFRVYKTAGSNSQYDTVRQVFNFHQNPDGLSSQTIYRPVIISNVSSGTADDAPLELRMTLRDAPSAGNIVAYNRDSWRVNDHLTTGTDQWVFVPVTSFATINATPVTYQLITEVANHTSIRYAAQDYRTDDWAFPSEWRFDLPRYQGTTDITRSFNLDNMSHIAPGLVSVYRRNFNINEQNKRPLRLFALDDTKRNGIFDLVLNHHVIYGVKLGTYEYRGTGNYNNYELTAYTPQPLSMDFYKTLARHTGSEYEEVSVPTSLSFGTSSVTHDALSMPADAIRYFTVSQVIPANYRQSSGHDTMLPLHVTMNIPVTEIRDREWYNDLLNEWHTSGNITRLFRENYDICLLTQTDGQNNPWNMSEELERLRVYDDQIKVFLDEDRGRSTQDNAPGLITVSFIVYLMDGTRDNKRPELSVVTDSTATQEHSYIVIRDGNHDDKWNMTFFIAPAGDYKNNTTITETRTEPESLLGDSDNSCNAGMSGMILLMMYFLRKGRS